jgi:hypothetical protein
MQDHLRLLSYGISVLDMLQEIRRMIQMYFNRLQAYLATAPPGSLQLTGVLGLAALLFAYYQLRRPAQPDRAQQGSTAGTSGAAGSGGRLGQAGSTSSATAAAKAGGSSAKQQDLASATPLGRAVRSKLGGMHKVTISALGALTEQWASTDLQEGATLRPAAVEVLREVAGCADTYVITQVQDDVGQAVMLGALEAAGLVGPGPGQVLPHHVLFCSTLDGKVSVVRQIEPDLHIDGAAKTIEDLKRFMPQLLHITQPGVSAAAAGSSNARSSSSLAAYFQ